MPAFTRMLTFLKQEYLPAGRTELGYGSLPDGARRYAHHIHAETTTAFARPRGSKGEEPCPSTEARVKAATLMGRFWEGSSGFFSHQSAPTSVTVCVTHGEAL